MNTIQIKNDYPNVICFCHNDNDGLLAAYAVKSKYDNNMKNSKWEKNVHCFPCAYGQKYNIDYYKNIVEENYLDNIENIVYMVDLSIQPYTDIMVFKNWLDEKNIKFYWIDHHMSAIEATKHLRIPGLQSTKKSGCWLTWYYLNSEDPVVENIDKFIPPTIISKISDYDIWNLQSKYSWQDELFPLTYFLESFGNEIDNNDSILIKLLTAAIDNEDTTKSYEKNGSFIYNWIKQQYKNNHRKMYECNWNDYDCLVVNSSFKGSNQFDDVPDIDKYDLLIAWSFNGERFEYAMYTKKPKINCGSICKTYLNGGGHPGAAGGNSKFFIFGDFKRKD